MVKYSLRFVKIYEENRFFSFNEIILIILRDSPIALITPIRDGMNLVAKEYVACQIDDPGVLILSPFTGIYFIAKIDFITFFEYFLFNIRCR